MLSRVEHKKLHNVQASPKVIELFSCSAQLRLKFILLINDKMTTTISILTSKITDLSDLNL